MAVGIGRTAAWLTVAVAFVALRASAMVPTATCRPLAVAAAPTAGEAADGEMQCARRCATEKLACAAASGCDSASATVWLRGEGSLGPCGGGGCESEYLGCIDVC